VPKTLLQEKFYWKGIYSTKRLVTLRELAVGLKVFPFAEHLLYY
jgi:hypothetical protein